MKRFKLLAFVLFLAHQGVSQNFDAVLVGNKIDCSDISNNSSIVFAKYLQEGKIDSAQALLGYWEQRCGHQEPITRAKILLSLKQRTFSDTILHDRIIEDIMNFKSRLTMLEERDYHPYDYYKSYYGFVSPGQEFDRYTLELASEVKNDYPAQSIEYLFAELYAGVGDSILLKLQSESYDGLDLKTRYDELVNEQLKIPEFHLSFISGVWVPTGGISRLGTHPELGFQLGMKHRRMNYDWTMSLKFLNTPRPYYARRTKSDNSVELTNNFFGAYIGVDFGYDVYVHKKHEVQLLGGIGFDGFDALESDEARDLESESTWTYNLNSGVGYRYYINGQVYIGVRAKYNVVDYTLNDVVDYTGHPITIQLHFGWLDHAYRNRHLEQLQYNRRK